MYTCSKFLSISVAAISIAAGAASSVLAQNQDPSVRSDTPASAHISGPTDMRTSRWLGGRSVHGIDGKTIAEVKDLLLDRGSGRVEYVIVKTDVLLGLGGHSIAIPYEQFDWDTTKEWFVLAQTKDQLQSYPEYTPERWNSMISKRDANRNRADDANNSKSPNTPNPLRDPNDRNRPADSITPAPRDPANPSNPSPRPATRDPNAAPINPNSNTPIAPPGTAVPSNPNSNTPTQPARDPNMDPRDESRETREYSEAWLEAARRGRGPGDQYKGRFDVNKQEMIEGTVTHVERVFDGEYGQEIVVTVTTNEGLERRIVMGPSWYVSGSELTPNRGDKVIIGSYLITAKDQDRISTASRYRVGDREVQLRDPEGNPTWSNERFEAAHQEVQAPYYRYLLASKLRGSRIDCRGTECGKVQDVIVDRVTGNVAYLAIDPNVTFLGIADTKRLVPWNVATVSLDGIVRLDASKEMILASQAVPTDIAKLNTLSDEVYKPYDVTRPNFRARDRNWDATYASGGKPESWMANGPICSGIDGESAKTIIGKVVDHQRISFNDPNIMPASAVVISVDNGPDEVVIIGPAKPRGDKNNARCKTGDLLTLDVCRTTVNGKKYWIARSLENAGQRTVFLDAKNNPTWDDR